MSVEVAVVSGVVNKSSGTTDYTVADFGTPTAVITVLNGSHAGANPRTNEYLSIGFTDGTNQFVCSNYDKHAETTTVTSRAHLDDAFSNLAVHNGNVTIGYLGSLIEDGVRIEWDGGASINYYITVYLIKGTTDVKCGVKQLGAGAGSTVISDVGFEASLVLFESVGYSATPPRDDKDDAVLSFGAAHNGSGGVSQGCVCYHSQDAVGTSSLSAAVRDDACIGKVFDGGTQTWKASAGSFGSSGFTLTYADAPGSEYVFWLALELPNQDDADVSIIDTPTSTGVESYEHVGWEPVGLIFAATNLTTKNSATNSADAGSLGIGFATAADEYSYSIASEHAEGTTDVQADHYTSGCMRLYYDDHASTSHLAALDSFDSDGFDLDFTDTDGTARKWLAISLGDSTAGGDVTGTFSSTLESVTSNFSGAVTVPGVSGTFAVTLSDVTSAMTGAVTPPAFTGTITSTLEDVSGNLSGTSSVPAYSGTFNSTLADVDSALSGAVTTPDVTGTFGATLDSVIADLSGVVVNEAVSGTFGATLENVSSNIIGAYTPGPITGTFTVTLEGVQSTIVGTVVNPSVTGTFDSTLEDVSA